MRHLGPDADGLQAADDRRIAMQGKWISALALIVSAFTAPMLRADTRDVFVYSFEFSVNPPGGPVVDAVITVGDTVRWVWVEGNHTTTSVAGILEQWDGALNSSSPTFSHTFAHTGVFWYYCRPHGFDNGDQTAGGMSGTVTVLAPGQGACCLPNGDCQVTSPAGCLQQAGVYGGDGSTCSPSPCANQPITLNIPADKDNILYENATGSVSDGAGRYLYTGNQNNGLKRRALLHFDVGGIPSGALIESVSLRLYCNQGQGSPYSLTLQRCSADWGEGTSDANGDESSGTAATTGDATWLHRFFNTTFWSTAGGTFASTGSANLSVAGGNALYTWTAPGLAADLQGWIDTPGTNFGWILRGDESSSANTKRFDSRQGSTPANRPVLSVTYRPFAPTGACCLPSSTCTQLSASQCAAQGGSYHGDGVTCNVVSCLSSLAPFVDALPLPAVAQPIVGSPGAAAYYQLAAREVMQRLHRDLPLTRVWGYGGSYPGPTIEARKGLPVTVTWINDLRVVETGALRTTHALAVDTCLHGPDMTGDVPVLVTHLHGGHVPVASDGYPDASFPPGQQSTLYEYPNNQLAATLWYHDHALGLTRLNVYMGLAGFYLLRDDAEDALNLPRGEFEVPLAIQDRSFNGDGSLRYYDEWHDHFFGDYVLVNGKVWPYFVVKQGKYRFRVLDGSNSRVYRLALSNGAAFAQIGSDTGLLPAPVPMTQLTLTPGERADIVIDFAPYPAGTELILTNDAPAPFPGTSGVGVIPNVMKFVVSNLAGDTDPLPATLVAVPRIAETSAVTQRNLVLRQMPNSQCPSQMDGMWMINGLTFDDITEMPRLGTTEIWAWVNRSGIAHPMHMHLVSFQVLDRQPIDVVTGSPTGPRVQPLANEMGWKDTVQAPPATITRVIARFEDYAGRYPYHCHILEHEDHEMMRQFEVVVDSDGDGVLDAADNCPLVANADQADADADFVGDACDACTDTDGDGYGDPGFAANTCALDGCPSDPLKSAPGQCGCGVAEIDSDGDGVSDCVDNCDSIANAGQQDCDGDGIGDVCEYASGSQWDANGNGTPDQCEPCPGVFSYCTPGTTSHGCTAVLSATGIPSASSTSGFVIRCTGVEGQKQGLIFYGTSGPKALVWKPGSSSYLCVAQPTQRTLSQTSGGTTNACDGTYAIDFLSYAAMTPGALGTPLIAGEIIDAQAWFRDPTAAGTTNLSNGLQFRLCP
jgi:spore coat protein A